jgi:hypothetical protein
LDLGFGSTLWMWEKSQWDEKRLEIWRKRKKDFVLLYKGHLRENTSDRDGNTDGLVVERERHLSSSKF